MKDCLVFTDKAMDLMLKDPTGKQLEDVLGGLREKRDCLNLCIRKKSQMAAIVRSVGARGFERKKLGDSTSMVKGNAFKSDEFKSEGFPILKVSDLQNRKIDTSKLLYTPQNNKYNQFIVKKNDILLVVTGSSTGKLAVNNTDLEFYLNQNAVVLRANNQHIEQQYLFHSLLSDDFQKLISNGLSGSAQPFVSCKSINEFDIPLPPLPIQHEVLAILNEMEAELATLEQMAAKAEQRAKFVLDGYLTPAPVAQPEPVVAQTQKPKKKIVIRDEE
jgi:type I restriction enzyme S subunit